MFDASILTGSVILLPLAWLWKITGGRFLAIRLVMLAFFWIDAAGAMVILAMWAFSHNKSRMGALALSLTVQIKCVFGAAALIFVLTC